MDSDILKVVPSPEELHIVGIRNQGSCRCPEFGCSFVALNACQLGLHKSQVHNFRTKHKAGMENVHYHCPVASCYFSSDSERYLKSFDTLRTHYMKVHSEKVFVCTKCNKTFGLERDCHRHEAECGESFSCQSCGKVYTNKSALRRHCDYNRHHSPALETKTKAEKKSKHKPTKVPDKMKGKQSAVIKSALPFILPKQVPPETAFSSQQNSLHIQTDVSGSLFFISKMASDSSISQAVQTMERVSMTRSAGIQTTFELQPSFAEASKKTDRLSTGIQTVLPHLKNFPGSLCVAQTQTNKSILLRAMTEANIPVLFEGTHKSVGHKKKKKSGSASSEVSQALHSPDMGRKNCSVNPGTSQAFFGQTEAKSDEGSLMDLSKSIDDMSTQTSLSCVSELIFPQTGAQLQDCHTQTQDNMIQLTQIIPPFLDQSRCFVLNSDQVTQTKSNFSSDQITQTGNIDNPDSDNVPAGFLSIQDNQTQTVHKPMNSGIIHNIQTQTSIAGITNTGQVQDQGTTCEGLLGLANFSKEHWNVDNDSGDLQLGEKYSGRNLRTNEATNDLRELLFEVIDNDIACTDNASSNVEGSKTRGQSTSMEHSLDGNFTDMNDKVCLPVVSMETQTSRNLGMDSMTQTVEDLGWDMSTQTADYLLTDMMTQTGDDILEFLTNDNHTQTLDDFCMNFEFDDFLGAPSSTGASTSSPTEETSLHGQYGDHVSTQTIWSEDQSADSKSASFVSLMSDAPFENLDQESVLHSEIFMEKGHKTGEGLLSYTKNPVSDVSTKWQNVLTSEARAELSDLGRETAETQTIYDPFFYNLNYEGTLSFPSAITVKYLESSHTQTTLDPILPAVLTDDDSLQLFHSSAFAQKGTTETQTGADYFSNARETAECQTPWETYITSVGTSETQTHDDDFLGVSCNDMHTQTIIEPELTTNLDFIHSFTQTSLDQNTQTGNVFDF